jgi:hypothetical protein
MNNFNRSLVALKIPELLRAIDRVARVAPPYSMVGNNPYRVRFLALWQARNRRTRVMMSRKGVI